MNKKSFLYGILALFVKNPGVISAGLVRFFKLGILAGIASLMAQGFWDEGLTPIGIMLLMAALGAAEKLLKEKWGVGLALAFALLLSQPAQAQTKILELQPAQFAVGGGSMFGDESFTFSRDAAFVAAQWNGVALFGDKASTGAGVEIHPATVRLFDAAGTQSIETVDWRLWSLNRVEASALQLPGEFWESMYLGGDLLVAEGGSTDYSGDFSARFVYGVKEGPVQLEFYMFEKYRPISFAFFYRF